MLALNPTFVETSISPDESVLDQARAGDPEAFGEICRLHSSRLLRQAMTLCGNQTQAEELAQDTFVEAWKSFHRFNGRCQLFTWLCAILLNRHRNFLRENRRLDQFVTRESAHSQGEAVIDPALAPDCSAQSRESARQLQELIAKLPAKHQQVIFLRFYVDDSLESIAAALGCSVGTVKSRLFHALEKLRCMRPVDAGAPAPRRKQA